jgi:hypothetical protein
MVKGGGWRDGGREMWMDLMDWRGVGSGRESRYCKSRFSAYWRKAGFMLEKSPLSTRVK